MIEDEIPKRAEQHMTTSAMQRRDEALLYYMYKS